MQFFKVFGPNGKLCERMDHTVRNRRPAVGPVRQSRDSRETCEAPCARLAKQPRDTCETSRNIRETSAKQPRIRARNPPRVDLFFLRLIICVFSTGKTKIVINFRKSTNYSADTCTWVHN